MKQQKYYEACIELAARLDEISELSDDQSRYAVADAIFFAEQWKMDEDKLASLLKYGMATGDLWAKLQLAVRLKKGGLSYETLLKKTDAAAQEGELFASWARCFNKKSEVPPGGDADDDFVCFDFRKTAFPTQITRIAFFKGLQYSSFSCGIFQARSEMELYQYAFNEYARLNPDEPQFTVDREQYRKLILLPADSMPYPCPGEPVFGVKYYGCREMPDAEHGSRFAVPDPFSMILLFWNTPEARQDDFHDRALF